MTLFTISNLEDANAGVMRTISAICGNSLVSQLPVASLCDALMLARQMQFRRLQDGDSVVEPNLFPQLTLQNA